MELTLRDTFIPPVESKWVRRPVEFAHNYDFNPPRTVALIQSLLNLNVSTPYYKRVVDRSLFILDNILRGAPEGGLGGVRGTRGSRVNEIGNYYETDRMYGITLRHEAVSTYVKVLCDHACLNLYSILKDQLHIGMIERLYNWVDSQNVPSTRIPMIPFRDSMTELMTLLKCLEKTKTRSQTMNILTRPGDRI
jgi:hypothetical protein